VAQEHHPRPMCRYIVQPVPSTSTIRSPNVQRWGPMHQCDDGRLNFRNIYRKGSDFIFKELRRNRQAVVPCDLLRQERKERMRNGGVGLQDYRGRIEAVRRNREGRNRKRKWSGKGRERRQVSAVSHDGNPVEGTPLDVDDYYSSDPAHNGSPGHNYHLLSPCPDQGSSRAFTPLSSATETAQGSVAGATGEPTRSDSIAPTVALDLLTIPFILHSLRNSRSMKRPPNSTKRGSVLTAGWSSSPKKR